MRRSKGMQLGAMLAAMLLVGVTLVVIVNAQGQDSGGKPTLDNMDLLMHDAQVYASNNNVSIGVAFDAQIYALYSNVSIDEALRRFQLQDIAGKLDAELSKNETETFAGLWIEHKPKFKIVVQFTRNGEETIKPYLKQYAELANIVEVRTANVSLANLRRDQANASSSVSVSGIPINSDINVYNNTVELYVVKADRSRFDNALQRREIRLPDKVRVITVEALAENTANIYGGLSLSTCTSGFSVEKGQVPFITKGITTAGHCSNTQSYNGNSLVFQSENYGGSYDIQWHTAPGYFVTNEIKWYPGSTRPITGTVSRSSQSLGETVCKYGMNTGYGCGIIQSKDYNPGGQDNQPTYIRVANTIGYNNLSNGGDSGGPWYSGNNAYGTMTHKIEPGTNGIGSDGVYMAVDYMSGIGVSIITYSI